MHAQSADGHTRSSAWHQLLIVFVNQKRSLLSQSGPSVATSLKGGSDCCRSCRTNGRLWRRSLLDQLLAGENAVADNSARDPKIAEEKEGRPRQHRTISRWWGSLPGEAGIPWSAIIHGMSPAARVRSLPADASNAICVALCSKHRRAHPEERTGSIPYSPN